MILDHVVEVEGNYPQEFEVALLPTINQVRNE